MKSNTMTIWALLLALTFSSIFTAIHFYQKHLHVALHPWPGYESILLAQRFNWLPEKVIVHETANASETIKLLRERKVQIAALTLQEALQLKSEGENISIIAILNESVGADLVVSRQPLQNLINIKGSRIALEGSAISDIVLNAFLSKAGVSNSDITKIYLAPNEQVAKWDDDFFDLAISYEPFATYLENLGALRVFDSSQFSHSIFDVLVMREDSEWFRKDLTTDLLAGHFRALEYIRVNQEDALRRIAAWRALTYDETRRAFGGLYLPDKDFNKRMLNTKSQLFEVIKQDQVMQGLNLTSYQLTEMVEPSFLYRMD